MSKDEMKELEELFKSVPRTEHKNWFDFISDWLGGFFIEIRIRLEFLFGDVKYFFKRR